ncbi:MAG: nitrous oxide reductase accessory protein NosL, partial [Planctomycetota bacterium]
AAEHPPTPETALFVVDHETGAWLAANKAHYVRSETLDTPMSSGLAAFGAKAIAAAAAKPLKGRVLDWEALCKEEAS